MAPKGEITPSAEHPGAFKLTFVHGGASFEIEPLAIEEEAALAADVLSIKEALDSGASLGSLQLHSNQGPPRFDLLDGPLRSDLDAASFEQVVSQLQDCATAVAGANKPSASGRLLEVSIVLHHSAAVSLLLAAGADGAAAADAAGSASPLAAAVLAASEHGDSRALQLVLSALPDPAAAVEQLRVGTLWTGLISADSGAAQLLLAAAPAAARRAGDEGWTVLHLASQDGKVAAVRLLLAAAPQLAAAQTARGYLPMHSAALGGNASVLRLLLAAAPATATVCLPDGSTPLAVAAACGHADVEAQLLAAAPQAVHHRINRGWLPIMDAAAGGHLSVLELLLAAAPDSLLAQSAGKDTALHLAAANAQPAAVSFLAAAVPAAAVMEDADGLVPLEAAVEEIEDASKLPATVRPLLAFGSGIRVLQALRRGVGHRMLRLFADFVACRPPLSEAEWALVPSPCPGLGRAMPAALAHSPEQARQLVLRLPAADAERLRLFSLCLHRAQSRLHVHLPQPLEWRILSLFA